jgi:4-hydroxythreonine-4-phosphate dehydrogenase
VLTPVIAVTAGDPCGVGPEVILKSLALRRAASAVPLLLLGDHHVFTRTARRLGLRLPRWQVRGPGETPDGSARLSFLDCGHAGSFVPGRASARAGRASLDYLDLALALWREGRIQALVTAPVTKWAVARTHPGFTGHTEYLAGALGVRDVAMMFVSDALRVVLVTRHVPLREVRRFLTPALLRTTIRLTADALRAQFDIRRPRLALCGLNPHAGEGAARSEERRIMRPVLLALRREGLRCEGPFSADGFFAAEVGGYDAVVCGYHDQGLIPFKMASRDRGCQLTIGLPLVRTSPDHGSALDIAGRGEAHPGSMRYALDLAEKLVINPAVSSGFRP